MTGSNLIRGAGLSAMVAGILYIIVQIIHPTEELSSISSNSWAITHYLTLCMSVCGLLGISGIYARQVKEAGWLGLVGFLMFFVWLILVTAVVFIEALILPLLVAEAPQFVAGFLELSGGSLGEVNFGVLEAVAPLSALLYVVGGSLFGFATVRAGLLPRWAAVLFIFGIVSTLLIPLLPDGAGRITVVPVGLGLAGLGYALWSENQEIALTPAIKTGGVL